MKFYQPKKSSEPIKKPPKIIPVIKERKQIIEITIKEKEKPDE